MDTNSTPNGPPSRTKCAQSSPRERAAATLRRAQDACGLKSW
ncbi:hypothetical protein Pla108_29060 [Botrimarina colliarenosi]|uniref:Uncharacterized protein n=1 Tax=Botrimarina colliarenosi TaxID=2528001 RepID=A0A5C6A8F1_9BACT|nr:hypothetical protein [Botrimarina colliarenosi]TWT95829.1 hypothetical protein Pla108_29060 [Botrimarina colliarenosi]